MPVIALLAILCILFVIGTGIAVAAAILAMVAILLAVGILSSSILIAIMRRSVGAGVRAVILQCATLAGAVVGVGSLWLASWLMSQPLSAGAIVSMGAASGMVAGLALGLLVNFTLAAIYRTIAHSAGPGGGFEVK